MNTDIIIRCKVSYENDQVKHSVHQKIILYYYFFPKQFGLYFKTSYICRVKEPQRWNHSATNLLLERRLHVAIFLRKFSQNFNVEKDTAMVNVHRRCIDTPSFHVRVGYGGGYINIARTWALYALLIPQLGNARSLRKDKQEGRRLPSFFVYIGRFGAFKPLNE